MEELRPGHAAEFLRDLFSLAENGAVQYKEIFKDTNNLKYQKFF